MTRPQRGARRDRFGALRWGALVVLVASAVVGPSASTGVGAEPTWRFEWLDPLPGRNRVTFRDANDTGVAVGSSISAHLEGTDPLPTAWDRDGNAYAFGLPAGFLGATAYAINDGNVAVGVGFAAQDGNLVQRSIVWRPGQAPNVLPAEESFGFPVELFDGEPLVLVNHVGEVHVVGGAQLQLPGDGGQVVPRDAQLRGGRGTVVGHQVVGGRQRAAVWGHTGMTLLAPAWGFDTTASGIAGRVVGVTYALDDEPVVSCSAAALHVDGTVVPLDPAADSSTVQDVTSFGIAVGTRTADGCGAGEGVVWIYGTPVPLRSLVGMPQDLQAAEVTEQLYFYGGGFLIRPA